MTVALPKAIQAEVDAAEQLMQGTQEPTAPALADPPKPPEPAPAPQPPAPPPEPSAPTTVATPEPHDQDADYWKRRFVTIEGKYRAEVPQLSETVRNLQSQLQAMQSQQAPRPEPKVEPLITPKDEEAFGTDLIDAMRRVSREESRALNQRLDALASALERVSQVTGKVDQVERKVQLTAEQMFYVELGRGVPDWQQVNADARWHAWLSEYDPVAGRTRQESLNEAHAAFDHARVAALFNMFKTTLPPAPAPQKSGQAELARQVAPSRSSTATVSPPAAKVFTSKEYAYWTDPRRVHTEDRAKLDAMLTELEQAQAEGRIDWSR